MNLKSLIKIKVNYKQVGSDRITNAISLMNNKDNFIILDFGTATTFDVLIKNTYTGGIIAPGIRLSFLNQNPIKKYEHNPTPSHPKNNCIKLSDVTNINIANVNKDRYAINLGLCGS